MDFRGAPAGIFSRHASNQLANLGCGGWSVEFGGSRSPALEQPKAGTMPADHGFWLNDDQRFTSPRPQSAKRYPEDAIRPAQSGARTLPLQHDQLEPQSATWKPQVVTGAKETPYIC